MADSWSGLRQKLENEFLCEKLRGRIQYFCTHYHNAPDDYGRIAIRLDEKECILGNPYSYHVKGYAKLELKMKRENKIPRRKWTSYGAIHDAENKEVEDAVKKIAMSDGNFEISDITDAIRIYTQSSIDVSLEHENPMVRLFAVLDYRVGKRRLHKIANTMDEQPQWLKVFYVLRLDAENINFKK